MHSILFLTFHKNVVCFSKRLVFKDKFNLQPLALQPRRSKSRSAQRFGHRTPQRAVDRLRRAGAVNGKKRKPKNQSSLSSKNGSFITVLSLSLFFKTSFFQICLSVLVLNCLFFSCSVLVIFVGQTLDWVGHRTCPKLGERMILRAFFFL